MAGFYSKDLIIETMIDKQINLIRILMFYASCMLTSIYAIKLVKRVKIIKKSQDIRKTSKKDQKNNYSHKKHDMNSNYHRKINNKYN